MIQILKMYAPAPKDFKGTMVNTCSNGKGWERELSPFILGPCQLYDSGLGGNWVSLTMENAWQFAKLYGQHADPKAYWDGPPGLDYWIWAKEGWNNPKAIRYPMGKGAKPLCSWWNGQRLSYIEARKKIYAPLYAEAVLKTAGFRQLQKLAAEGDLVLRDFDGYDHDALGMTLTQVLNDPKRKMGHAFVLKMLLTQDEALKQIELRGGIE